VLNRWVMSLLMLVLLIGVLKVARVPLTAFAFLGGALAIGVGFGTQTIIKNLISGVIILFERKVRVGDVVTIDGVSGTSPRRPARDDGAGLRRHRVDGPELPAAGEPVSNWSYQSRNVRRVLDVGLAYGHDHELAMRAIADCAAAHASVLRMPAPEVMLPTSAPMHCCCGCSTGSGWAASAADRESTATCGARSPRASSARA